MFLYLQHYCINLTKQKSIKNTLSGTLKLPFTPTDIGSPFFNTLIYEKLT